MSTFIAFLRAVNLGRTRKVPMAEARVWLAEAGLGDVETYIQTGNLRFTTSLRSRAKVESLVEQVLADACGFDVPTMAFTPAELRAAHGQALRLEAPEHDELRRYVTFLKEEPPAGASTPIHGWDLEGEAAHVAGRTVLWWIAKTNQEARLSNARIEKALGPATTRDLKVVSTLVERWGD